MTKFLSEFAPLIAFFIGYKYGGIQGATLFAIIASVTSVALIYAIYRKISSFAVFSTALLVVSGGITLLTGNSAFIKIKPTILYIIFGLVFCISSFQGKPFLKLLLTGSFSLQEKSWNILSYRFAGFFFIMAVANEVVWRNFAEKDWVTFKVFYALPITLVFIISQLPFLMKNAKN